MSKHLFLFTIGPVQSFIAQARKTQDLYAGSQILTELIKTAINKVGKKNNLANIIFPYAYPTEEKKWDKVESLPNRFVAIINSSENLEQLATDTEKAVKEKWRLIAGQATFKCIEEARTLKIKASFSQQIEQHLEISWLFQPIIKDDYKKSYQLIEQRLGAIKNIRVFKQYDYNSDMGEKGRKCSLDGERNALFFGEGTNENYFKKSSKWNPDACVLKGTPKVKVLSNEGLSAVSFVKRFYKKGEKFPSTAKIALYQLTLNKHIREKIKELENLFDYFDYQLLYDENLTPKYFDKHGIAQEKLSKAKPIIKSIRQLARDNNIKMNSYYALVSFDGDDMGQWLSMAEDRAQHNMLSKLLMEFAGKAKQLVDQVGRTIYAGGDDFLGLINLEDLLETIIKLREGFDEVAKDNPIPSEGNPLSISMGVVIAHYKTPLGIVVKRAKEAEKAAKNSRDIKDSIAIDFITHSGNSRLGIIPFGQIGENLKKVKFIYENLQENFSDKWIKSFTKTFDSFTDLEKQPILEDAYVPMATTELNRLILRSCKLKDDTKKETSITLQENAFQLFKATDFHFFNFIEMLHITSALVSKTSN